MMQTLQTLLAQGYIRYIRFKQRRAPPSSFEQALLGHHVVNQAGRGHLVTQAQCDQGY